MAQQETGFERQDRIDALKAELLAIPKKDKAKIRTIMLALIALAGVTLTFSSASNPNTARAQEQGKEKQTTRAVPAVPAIPGVNLDQMVMDTERDTNEAIAEARARRIAAEAELLRAEEATALARRMLEDSKKATALAERIAR